MDRLLLVGPVPIAWLNPQPTNITMFVIPAALDYFKSFRIVKELLSLCLPFIEKRQHILWRFVCLVAIARPELPMDKTTPPVNRQCVVGDRG
jgi:hypothetical protein